jgi:hypothetical protein
MFDVLSMSKSVARLVAALWVDDKRRRVNGFRAE